jgi:hypothetical protein
MKLQISHFYTFVAVGHNLVEAFGHILQVADEIEFVAGLLAMIKVD